MSTRIAIIYGTGEGQTKKIAHHMAADFGEQQLEAECYNVDKLPRDFGVDDYSAIVVGASVHMGRFPRSIQKWVEKNRETLRAMPSAFFSVSLTASEDDERSREEITNLIDGFLEELDWQPALVASFAGAIPFSQYGFIRTLIMKRIVRKRLGEVDTSRDYEYTDWASVDEFVEQFRDRVRAESSSDEEHRPRSS